MFTLPRALSTRLLVTALLAAVLGLSACGKKDGAPGATQVAAKVGSEEISIHQILSRTRTGDATPAALQALSREVLEKLIDQQLAIDQTMQAKMHRDPEVVAQIEAARRDILARAYAQTVASAQPQPSAQEVKQYFADNPALFSQRRLFTLQEILVQDSAAAESLRGFASTTNAIEDVSLWLTAKKIPFGRSRADRAAEQVPLNLLARVHALQVGQSALFETAQGFTLLRVVSSRSAPVAEAEALPRIEQFLSNQRAREAIADNFKTLRASTAISYLGEFAQTHAAALPAPQAGTAGHADPARVALDKGVAGLK